MTWEWSHSEGAYSHAEQHIRSKPREWLEVVWAEWVAAVPHPQHGMAFHANLDSRKYQKALVRAKNKTDEELADLIWQKASELRNCTNGGWEAHCCPFGCSCHMVPFDRNVQDPDGEVQQGVDEDSNILWVRTDLLGKWCEENISEVEGYDGDSYVAPDYNAMREMVARMQKAGFDINVYDGFDTDAD
jgi:hypothetical protein